MAQHNAVKGMLVPEDLHQNDVKTEDSNAWESKLLESVGTLC